MSYSFLFSGDAETVGQKFDSARDECAGWGMVDAELRDIDEARDFVMQLADTHGPVSGSCSGHWTIFGGDDPRNRFGGINVVINAMPVAEEAPKDAIEPAAV